MWRLLPIVLLASCAANEALDPAAEGQRPDSHRVVNQVDLPVAPSSNKATEQAAIKEFRRRDTRGSIQESGAWRMTLPVTHARLRCATYETGIQLGVGDPACSEVRWLTDLEVGTRQTQCNAATLIHSGGGESVAIKGALSTANCVRIVTQCDGPC